MIILRWNGVFTQVSNQTYSFTGHLLQGRFKAILLDSENYLKVACPICDAKPD